MPPAQQPLSVVLKYSTASFFVLVPTAGTFSALQSTLLSLVTANAAHLPPSLTTNLPDTPQSLRFGVPKDPADPKKSGFVALDERSSRGTLVAAGIKDNAVLAFAIVSPADEDSWDGEFDVQWPVDDYYDSQGK
ncbi:hypothetical protein DRE_01467 [Drechslerella stenobrocha 248]|uniref:Uncharacterized protein n=1 Tax=Drechslerella stenobrocha 248 TaxID=1043628 RepID=W7I4D6_9PEZI|nr:hypothetical protein DRE_01467 [Drechslerella stenobrocha 248]